MSLLSRLSPKQKTIAFQACLGAAATVVVCMLAFTDIYNKIELAFLDARFSLRKDIPMTERVLHIDIDDLSIDALGRWPWNRDVHGRFIDTLTTFNPGIIVLDVEFPDPSNVAISERELQRVASEEIAGCFAGMREMLSGLGDTLRMFIENRSPTAVPPKEQLEMISEWHDKLDHGTSTLEKAMTGGFKKARIDYDREMAAAITRSGKVFVAFCFPSEEEISAGADKDLESEVRGLLKQDFTMSPTMIASVLKVDTEKVVSILQSLKTDVAFELVGKELEAEPSRTLDDISKAILPSYRPEEGAADADAAVVALAYRKIKAGKLLAAKFTMGDKPEMAPLASSSTSVVPPLFEFLENAAGAGFVNIVRNPLDGKLREVYLFWRYNDRVALQLGFAAILKYLSVSENDIVPLDAKHLELRNACLPGEEGKKFSVAVPMTPEGAVLINWPKGDWKSFLGNHISYGSVYQLCAMRSGLVESMSILGASEEYGCAELVEKWLAAWKNLEECRLAVARGAGAEEKAEDALKQVDETTSAVLSQIESIIAKMREAKATLEKEPPEKRRYAMIDNLTKSIQLTERQAKSLSALAAEEKNLTARLEPLVKGSVCLVGSTHSGSTDLHPTPYSPAFPGCAIHSALMNMVITRSFLYRTPRWINFLLIALAGIITTAATMNRGALASSAITAGILATIVASGLALFTWNGVWMDMVGPATNSFLCFAVMTAYRQLTTEREKRQVKNAFKHYVSPNVLEEIMREPTQLKLGGQRREVTVFVSDLQGFTTLSETLPSEEIVNILNMYFSGVTPLIFDTEGTVDKYQGDGLMAFWGGPAEQRDHAMRAVLTGLTYQEKVKELRKAMLQKGYPEIRASIGMNTGVVIVGNLGSSMRMDYSVIGDNVNLAYRIEGVNREFKTSILISESTYLSATEFVEAREIDYIRVKGRVKPVRLYELQSRKRELPAQQTEVNAHFAKGLEYYRLRAWKEAIDSFQKGLDLNANDYVSALFIKRCQEFSSNPPPDDWDMVYEMKRK